MFLHLTYPQMLARWRVIKGLYPVLGSGSVTVTLPEETDALLHVEIEKWYTDLLATADPALLAPTEISDRVTLTPCDDGGGLSFELPDVFTRLVSVRLHGWECAARIIPDPTCPEARRQRDPFTRATAASPVAVLRPGGIVTLYPATHFPEPVHITALGRPDTLYHFDESLLSS